RCKRPASPSKSRSTRTPATPSTTTPAPATTSRRRWRPGATPRGGSHSICRTLTPCPLSRRAGEGVFASEAGAGGGGHAGRSGPGGAQLDVGRGAEVVAALQVGVGDPDRVRTVADAVPPDEPGGAGVDRQDVVEHEDERRARVVTLRAVDGEPGTTE